MSKPKTSKCSSCEVNHNALRCGICKYCTDEFRYSDDGYPIIGEFNMYKEKKVARSD